MTNYPWRVRAALIAAALFASATQAEVSGPACAVAWDLVDDARVKGYRFYVDGELKADLPGQATAEATCEQVGITPGQHSLHATAYGDGQESEPSNTIEIDYDPSEMLPPSLRLTIKLEVNLP